MDPLISEDIKKIKNPETRINYRGAILIILCLAGVIGILWNIIRLNTKEDHQNCEDQAKYWKDQWQIERTQKDSILLAAKIKADRDLENIRERYLEQESNKRKLKTVLK